MGVQEVADRTVALASNDDRNGSIPLTAAEYSELQAAWRDVKGVGLYSLRSRLASNGLDASIADSLTKGRSYAEYCDQASMGI